MGLTFREPFYKPITEEQVVNGIGSVMGLYFCSGDRIVFWNLKVGTFQVPKPTDLLEFLILAG